VGEDEDEDEEEGEEAWLVGSLVELRLLWT
jgi:hypothetical protein